MRTNGGAPVPDCNGSWSVSEVRLLVLYWKSWRSTLGGFVRTIFLFPLTALVAVAAGCGSGGRQQATRSTPQRDLTLVTPTGGVEIASPVEMQQLRIHHRTIRQAPRSSREPRIILATMAAPLAALGAGSAPVLAVPEPVAQPVSTEATPANDRELLPGKTVTVIPASSTPSTGSDTADELPAEQGRTTVAHGGGGGCRGRGRGPGTGMSPAPRPDFR